VVCGNGSGERAAGMKLLLIGPSGYFTCGDLLSSACCVCPILTVSGYACRKLSRQGMSPAQEGPVTGVRQGIQWKILLDLKKEIRG
jgi:hypothetical protein